VQEALAEPCATLDERLNQLRVLRNACASGCDVQQWLVVDQENFISETLNVAQELAIKQPSSDNLELTLTLQLLHNAYVGQHELTARDSEKLSNTVLACIKEDAGAKVRGLAAALVKLVVVATSGASKAPFPSLSGKHFGLLLRDARDSEFAALACSTLAASDIGTKALQASYDTLTCEERAAVLEVSTSIPYENDCATGWANFAADRFKRLATSVMVTLKTAPERADPVELLAALDTLCHFSADHTNAGPGEALRNDKSLLIDTVYLLRMAHEAGKEDASGVFAPVNHVAEVAAANVEDNPIYGMKSHLVRLVGNLCWECKANQDQTREIEGIQLLLDCCSIDAKNPLMIQWVVFALRNLCRDNEENRNLLASVDGAGVAVHTLEQEFGVKTTGRQN